MLRSPVIAFGFVFVLMLSACAPPQEDPQAAEEQAAAEALMEAEEAAEAAEQEAEQARQEADKAREEAAAARASKPQQAAAPAPPPVCNDCGTIASIQAVKEKGAGSGAGAVMGAIAGGVIGHQFGGGSGQDVATAAGAIAGGFGGHEAEKRIRATSYYQIGVNMDGGGYQTVNVPDPAGLTVGTPVRVVGGNIQRR